MAKEIPSHVVIAQSAANSAVNSVVTSILNEHYTTNKLKSKKFESIHGAYHENLKTAQKYVNAEFRRQKNEAIKIYSKERATELVESAIVSFTHIKLKVKEYATAPKWKFGSLPA